MTPDYGKQFNEIFRVSGKTAKCLINGGIRQLVEGVDATGNSLQDKVLNSLKSQSVAPIIYVFAFVSTLLVGTGIIARLMRSIIGWGSDLLFVGVALLATIIFLTFYIASMWLSDRTWSTVDLFQRRQIKADLFVEEWVRRKLRTENLMAALQFSLGNYETRRSIVIWMGSLAGLIAGFSDAVLGEQIPLYKFIGNLVGRSIPQPSYWVILGFVLTFVTAYFITSLPIEWRRQLEPHLQAAVEKYKFSKALCVPSK